MHAPQAASFSSVTDVPASSRRNSAAILATTLFPGCLLVGVSSALLLLRSGVPAATVTMSIAVSVLFLIAVMERVQPYERAWTHSQGDLRADIASLLVVALGLENIIAILGPGIAVATYAGLEHLHLSRLAFPAGWPVLAQAFLLLALSDLAKYWFHRFGHEHDWGWRLHSVHHAVKRVYWLNGFRIHPLYHLVNYIIAVLPWLCIGVQPDAVAVYCVILAISAGFQHANIDLSNRFLNFVFNTNELHRWHHSRRLDESNANYGAVLVLWDLLFGTYRPLQAGHPRETGMSRELGYPMNSYFRQLIIPFQSDYWRKPVAEPAVEVAVSGEDFPIYPSVEVDMTASLKAMASPFPGMEAFLNVTHQQTISRALTHKLRLENVYVTSLSQLSETEFLCGAFVPQSNAYINDMRSSAQDASLVIIEIGRQTGIALSHKFLGVGEDEVFILNDMKFEIMPGFEAVDWRQNDTVWSHAHITERKYDDNGQLCAALASGRFFVGETCICSQESHWTIHSKPRYSRIRKLALARKSRRQPAEDAASAYENGLKISTELSLRRSLLEETLWFNANDNSFTGKLRVDRANLFFFDHENDHVPGMLILEGMRSLAGDISSRSVRSAQDGTRVRNIGVEFKNFAELDMPVYLIARIDEAAEGDQAGTVITVEARQQDLILASGQFLAV